MLKTIALIMGIILALGLAACEPGPSSLRITLPDQEARDQAVHIRISAIEPGDGAGCQTLLDMNARPGDESYMVVKSLDFAYPVSEDIGDLSDVGSGRRLFYAEAENDAGDIILNGCTAADAGEEVTIALAWLTYECTPTRGGVEWCDGLDNDCDRIIDGPDCLPCSTDEQCDSLVDCLVGTCADGFCQMSALNDGDACDDGDPCTEDDTCQGGQCSGAIKDCSDEFECTTDGCDEDTGLCTHELQPNYCLITTAEGDACVPNGQTQAGNGCYSCDTSLSTDSWQVAAAGTSCDDGLWCTGVDTCDENGLCQHADLPCTETCMSACDEGSQSCVPDEQGTVCEDGFSCTAEDACDGEGHCVGEAIPDYCGTDQECLPECASDAIGCVNRPNYIVVNCPSEAPTNGEAVCSLTLNGGAGLEDCLHCRLELLPSIISNTDFYATSCNLGDWELNTGAACSSSTMGYCPLQMNDPLGDCADTYVCNSGDRTVEFRRPDYAPGGWRLEQTFDFSSYDKVRVCYGAKQGPEPFGGSLELLTDPGDELNGNVVDCMGPGSLASDYPSHPCVDLPGSITDMEQTRLSFLAQVSADDENNMLGMSGVRVSAYPPECNQEVAVLDESFANCGHGITGAYNGWNFSQPANCVETQSQCGNTGGLLLGSADGLSSPQINATYALNLRSYVNPGQLCWTEYATAGFAGEYRLSFQSIGGSAAWYEAIYESQMPPMALASTCRDICIDIRGPYTSVMGIDGFGLGINGSTSGGGTMLLSNFRLYASQACDATNVLDISEVEEDGTGGHQVRVSSSQGLPRRARVTCTWGNAGMQTRREIEFKSCTSLAELRTLPLGLINEPLCPLYVTYIGANNIVFLQDEPSGPAIPLFDPAFAASVSLGDRVQLRATQLGEYDGQLQITDWDRLKILSQGHDLEPLVQDLSSGIPPTEDLEAELVRVVGAQVTELNGNQMFISYGTASNVNLYSDVQPAGMCLGATFDYLGPVTKYNSIWELKAHNVTDFTNLDTSSCP